jgi:hypothetical protein
MRQTYPKILPWVARKAAVPRDKAEALWMEALRDASDNCAVPESSEYWKMAVNHLLASLAPGTSGGASRNADVSCVTILAALAPGRMHASKSFEAASGIRCEST